MLYSIRGIAMKKLKKIGGACAPLALWYVSGKEEDAVLRICQAYGFKEEQGMDDADWKNAAAQLGIKMRAVPFEECSLKKFIKNHPAGLYLVCTFDHIFSVDNGIIIDPRNKKPPGLARKIKQAWKIEK